MTFHSVSTPPRAVRGMCRNLVITRPSVTQVTITATEMILNNRFKNLLQVKLDAVNVTADITAAGANGLDTGSEAGNTWYYVWVISDGSTTAALLSTSAGSPTMPSGYTFQALVGAVRNDGSSDFINFKQEGRIYQYIEWITMVSGNVGSGSWTSINMSAFVPSSLSTNARGTCGGSSVNVAVSNDSSVSSSVTTGGRNKILVVTGANDHEWPFYLDIITANTLYWADDAANGLVRIQGFFINKSFF